MHAHAYQAVAQMLTIVPTPTTVLEVGSRDINGSVRPLFPDTAYVGVDLLPGPGVDLVGDVRDLPLAPAECVVCCEVLEHVEDAEGLIKHLVRLVAPSGSLLVTCATEGRAPHNRTDGGAVVGEHYANIREADLRAWVQIAGLRIVYDVERQDRGDLYLAAVRP